MSFSRILKQLVQPHSDSKMQERKIISQTTKLVVAHFMVGNTAVTTLEVLYSDDLPHVILIQPYTPADWEEDIRLASSHGIDGFALNVGKETWQLDQVSDCFEAAERTSTDFKLFLSFDMSSLPSSSSEDVNLLKAFMSRFALHAHYLFYKGKALVSTFAGENALFGCTDLDSAWLSVKKTLGEVCPIYFIPSFFVDPARFRYMRCLDGAFNWNGCWPVHLTPDSPPEEIRYPKLLSDIAYQRNLDCGTRSRKAYMASVSPWFFTHYGKDSWNKNWIYRGDDWLLVRRWQQLIDMRDDVDIVQILSWNDYGESHYIGPIKGAQPNSEKWVDGFDHTAWLHLCGFYARLFKSKCGIPAQPNPLTVDEDRIYVWARPHPRDVEAYADSVGKPTGWELTDDVFWLIVLARSSAQVMMWSIPEESHYSGLPHSASSQTHTEHRIRRHNVHAGLSMLSCPLVAGGGIYIWLMRDGDVVLHFHPQNFVFNACPKTYNFNAYVAMHPS